VARGFAEDEVTARVRASLTGEGPTHVRLESFPFLGRLAVSGRVERLTVHQEDVVAKGLQFDSVDVDLRGVRIDRGQLLRSRQVELTGIERGSVSATLGLAGLTRLAGGILTHGVRLDDGVLVIGDVRIDLSGVPLLPCASRLRFVGASIVLTCSLHDPPVELLPAVPSLS
jgi:hypothetical protein